MKKTVYRLITGALLICWMAVIFSFSAQPDSESEQMSGEVSYRVIETCKRAFSAEMSEGEVMLWAQRIDYPVRKAAHMTEYAILAILAGVCLLGYRHRDRKLYAAALLFCFCYAATDEVHQLFVAGRSGRFSDVCIDTMGAAIGLFFLGIVLKILRKHCEKKKLPLK